MNDLKELNTQQDLVLLHLDDLEKKIQLVLDEYMGDVPLTNRTVADMLEPCAITEEGGYDEYREQNF